MILGQRLIGAALVLMALLPVHRVLDPHHTGPAGAATRDAGETAWILGWTGTFIVLTLAWVAMRMQPATGSAGRTVAGVWSAVLTPGAKHFAVFTGALATVGAGLVASEMHGRGPTTVDEMAHLLHASAVAGGHLTVPAGESAAAFVLQNGIISGEGWASIYPPFHTLVLALGLLTGAAWLVGPILTGVATGTSTWAIERAAGASSGRLAGLLLCVSPFWLLLGGTHLSHTSAAAGLGLLAVSSLAACDARSRRSEFVWSVAMGMAIGMAVTARPWVGLVGGIAIVAAAWGPNRLRGVQHTVWLHRVGPVVLGGLPFAFLLFWWNATLFGHPWRLGYAAAFGPSHGLGLHVDPWGNRYGIVEAIGYTGTDLLLLGGRLLESPLPATLLVAGALLLVPGRVAGRMRLPLLWAISITAGNALYWHHGIFFGPRMMYESVPAWMGLVGITVVTAFESGQTPTARFSRWIVGMTIASGLVLSLSILTGPAPASPPHPQALSIPPNLFDVESADTATPPDRRIVFVHGSWGSRVSARLVAAGMRRDSVETALRRNDLCAVDRYSRWRAEPSGPAPVLDFEPLPGSPTDLQVQILSSGNRIRVAPAAGPDASCRRERRSDRLGVLELEPLAWRAPALPGAGLLFARDLGPGVNLRLFESDVDDALVWIDHDEEGVLLLPYQEGMQLLWGGPGE